MSGGLEKRHFSCLSSKTKSLLKIIAKLVNDNSILKSIDSYVPTEDDELLLAVIHPGRDILIDKLIDLLQAQLLKKTPFAKVGGEEGMVVCRWAFASILSLNKDDKDLSLQNLMLLREHLEMEMDESGLSQTETDSNNALFEELNSVTNLKSFQNQWEAASRMRVWLQEKKKDISNEIQVAKKTQNKKSHLSEAAEEENDSDERENEVEDDDAIANEDNELDDEEDEGEENEGEENEGEENEGEEDEGEDDSEEGKNEQEEKEINEETKNNKSRNEEDPEKLTEEEVLQKEKEELQNLVKKVVEKAEFMLKLATPSSWNKSELRSLKLLSINSSIKPKKKLKVGIDKLKSLREFQLSKSLVKSSKNTASNQVMNSCSTSVLAVLQCPLTAEWILRALELRYVNCIKRIYGFELIKSIIQHYMQDENKMIKIIHWFRSALKQKATLELCHYSDDLNGAGEYLLNIWRTKFFDIYEIVIQSLGHSKNRDFICSVLPLWRWKITATDHKFLLKSGILNVIKSGNGDENHPIAKA
jgi:hypothetical protein